MIDVTNSHIDYRRTDAPIKFSLKLNEPHKSSDSTQRNFYQKMKQGQKKKSRSRIGPAAIVDISDQAKNPDSLKEVEKQVLRYDRFCRVEYMDIHS